MKLLHLEHLRDKKNLLAFSAGADSACLYAILRENGIAFDIAMVDYGVRKQARREIKCGIKLAKKHKIRAFIFHAPKIARNFECEARNARYAFFTHIIATHKYDNLILAHQLNDRIEWLLMQLAKGCGLNSLLGFSTIESREISQDWRESWDFKEYDFRDSHKSNLQNAHKISANLKSDSRESKTQKYHIVRPLSEVSRQKILRYLKARKIPFFIDKSNDDSRFLRNYFRKKFVKKLIKNFEGGIIKSLHFLNADFLALYGKNSIKKLENIYILKRESSTDKATKNLQILHSIDKIAKNLGYVISQKQRSEIVKSDFSCVVGDKIVIDSNEDLIFITSNLAPKICHDKKSRDILRKNAIPPKIRPFVKLEWIKKD